MSAVQVLLVEDNPTWQAILATYIQLALPGCDLQSATNFQEATAALAQGDWDLLVTDIGLPPDSGHVLGIQLVDRAKARKVPCIVVSGTEAVTRQLVRDMLRDYKARDFFSKEELEARPDRQLQFQEVVRQCTTASPSGASDSTASPGSPGRQVAIGIRAQSLYLRSDGLANLVISSGLSEKLFILFANNVSEGLPAKVVKNTVLNEIVKMPTTASASQLLRNTIKQLNDLFRDWAHLGKTRWIMRGHAEHGYCLNTKDVQWDVEKELRRHLHGGRTLWDVLVDPRKMAANTPDREGCLPSFPRRKHPLAEEGEL